MVKMGALRQRKVMLWYGVVWITHLSELDKDSRCEHVERHLCLAGYMIQKV